MTAPTRPPLLHEPWKPGINTRPENRSTVIAWVFIDTSSIPWKKPQSKNAKKKVPNEPVSPMNGPETQ